MALTRGGLLPAAILARQLDARVVDSLGIARYGEQRQEPISVLKAPAEALAEGGAGWLLVDDLVATGASAREARPILPRAPFATICAKPEERALVDTISREVSQDTWLFFPWDTEPRYVEPLADAKGRD